MTLSNVLFLKVQGPRQIWKYFKQKQIMSPTTKQFMAIMYLFRKLCTAAVIEKKAQKFNSTATRQQQVPCTGTTQCSSPNLTINKFDAWRNKTAGRLSEECNLDCPSISSIYFLFAIYNPFVAPPSCLSCPFLHWKFNLIPLILFSVSPERLMSFSLDSFPAFASFEFDFLIYSFFFCSSVLSLHHT